MPITNKSKTPKRPARLGRPPKPRAAKRAERADGERLSAALQALELSQNAAARLTGIRQGWLTNIINGNRAIGREDLRRLGKLKISADYVLGVEGAPMFRGETRSKAELADDFARYVARDLEARVPLASDGIGNEAEYRWGVRGEEALAFCARALAEQALSFRHALRARNTQALRLGTLAEAGLAMVSEWNPTGPGAESDLRCSHESAHAVLAILEQIVAQVPEIATPLQFPDWLEGITVNTDPETTILPVEEKEKGTTPATPTKRRSDR